MAVERDGGNRGSPTKQLYAGEQPKIGSSVTIIEDQSCTETTTVSNWSCAFARGDIFFPKNYLDYTDRTSEIVKSRAMRSLDLTTLRTINVLIFGSFGKNIIY